MDVSQPLAIIGMACQLPGAKDLDSYWKLLIEGRSAIGEMPASRINRELYFDEERGRIGRTYTTTCALVEDSPLPEERFRLSESDVELAEMPHLRLLHVAADAMRQAGLDPNGTDGARIGVYVGHTRGTSRIGDLQLHAMAEETFSHLRAVPGFAEVLGNKADACLDECVRETRRKYPATLPAGTPRVESWQAAAIISRAFGFDGPYLTMNAACSSTLTGLAYAQQALSAGTIDCAVVGGSSYCKMENLLLFSRAQSCSATGSRPFDDSADGLVAGEGYVCCVVKTLARAIADGDPIEAVIRGIGLSSDGKGKSHWAPRKEGQIEAVRRAYGAELTPDSLQYIEAHATSTLLGDSTEIEALSEVFTSALEAGKKIPIGSSKGNIGHTLEPAGIAGLIKTVLAIKHRRIPPTINVENLNSKVDWNAIPFVVARDEIAWPRPLQGPRRAAINAFGVGGINAHVVVEEYEPERWTSIARQPARNAAKGERAIAIVGVGVISPIGKTFAEFETAIVSQADGFTSLDEARAGKKYASRTAGVVGGYEYNWRKHKIPPKSVTNADPLQFMLLDAVDQAFESSGYTGDKLDKAHTAVIVGNMFGGEFAARLQVGLKLPEHLLILRNSLQHYDLAAHEIETLVRGFEKQVIESTPALWDELGSFTTSSLATRITKTYDLMGGACAIDAGDASGPMSLEIARNLLLSGDCKMVVCGACQRSLGSANLTMLENSQRLSPASNSRPFGESSDGLIPGEAAGVVLLKTLSDAERDGDRILGIIHEIGFARGENPVDSRIEAAKRAHANGDFASSEIDFIESATTGVLQEDQAEITALISVYSEVNRALPKLEAIAARIGHTGGASGMMSLLKSLVKMQPANVAAGKIENNKSLRTDITNACAITSSNEGLSAHVLLSRTPRRRNLATHANDSGNAHESLAWGVRCMTEETNSSLLARIDEYIEVGDAALKSQDEQPAGTGFGIAWIGRNEAEFREKARFAAKYFEHPERTRLFESQGIYYAERTQEPRVAFLFPGQGSQYPGMLQGLTEHDPAAAATMWELDETAVYLGFPTFREMTIDRADQLGVDVFQTQAAILAAEVILFRKLLAWGLRPDVLSAHSYGEFTALYAAGVWDYQSALLATKARTDSIDECMLEDCAMLSCGADELAAKQLCDIFPNRLFVANRNAPDQVVLGGTRSAILSAAEHAESLGLRVKRLDVPRPYHTPLLRDAQEPFRKKLLRFQYAPPQIPILSGVDRKLIEDEHAIPEKLAAQLTRPVDFVEQIRLLIEDGIDVLIEVGPSQVLTGLARRIVLDSNVLALATDHKKRSSAESLARLQAGLRARGVATTSITPMNPVVLMRPSKSLPESFVFQAAIDSRLPIIEMAGTPYDMGRAYGSAARSEIVATLERLGDLADFPSMRALPAIDEAYRRRHELFLPSSLEEMRGMAEGAGINLEAILALNLYGYSDIGVGCTQAFIPASGSRGMLFAANEDQPLGLFLREALRRGIQVRRPSTAIAHVILSPLGFRGGFNGINAAGIVVTGSMLLDLPRRAETRAGYLHAETATQILTSARTLEEALEIVQSTKKTGAWALYIGDTRNGKALHVEYDGDRLRTRSLENYEFVANHTLQFAPIEATHQHSKNRLQRLQNLSKECGHPITVHDLQKWMRDRFDLARGKETRFPTMNTIRRVDNQVSIVIDPNASKLYSTRGPFSENENEYFELDLQRLIGLAPTTNQKSGVQAPAPKLVASTSVPFADSLLTESAFLLAASSRACHPQRSESDPLTYRFVPKLLAQRLPEASDVSATVLPDGYLILGANAVADAVERRLQSRGLRTARLRESSDYDRAVAELERLWTSGPLPHLINLTDWNDVPSFTTDSACWQTLRQDFILTPFRICQRWMTLLDESKATLSSPTLSFAVATRMGGHFGFGGPIEQPLGGFATGFAKAVAVELHYHPHWKCRTNLVDFAPDESPDFVAERLLAECFAPAGRVKEVGYLGGERYRTVVVPVEADVARPARPDLGRVWVVTGGARGVTAEIVRALGKAADLKLHLLGSSEVPAINDAWRDLDAAGLAALRKQVMQDALARKKVPVQEWNMVEKQLEIDKNLRAFRAAGLHVEYHHCDVTDRSALQRVLDRIRGQDGPIDGVVHGAGFEKAASLGKKKIENVAKTLAVKVDAALSLMELTRHDPLKYFVGFGSVSGRFGAVGQTDYCFSNDLLAKVVCWYRTTRPEVHAAVLDWQLWADVGMGVRPETKNAEVRIGLISMPVAEGVAHFLNELTNKCPNPVVVFANWTYFQLVQPETIQPRQENSTTKGLAATKRSALNTHGKNIAVIPKDSLLTESAFLLAASSRACHPQRSESDPLTYRFVPKLLAQRLPEASEVSGTVLPDGYLILGANAVADAVERLLNGRGLRTVRVRESSDYDRAVAELERLWTSGPLPHLINLTDWNDVPSFTTDSMCWQTLRQNFILTPFRICQRWMTLLDESKATLSSPTLSFAVATRLGGHFGFGGPVEQPLGGFATGFAKAVAVELHYHPHWKCRTNLVDFAPDESPDFVAERLLAECFAPAGRVKEVGYLGGERYRTVVVPVEADVARLERPDLGRVWVVTGGARGVTAEIVRALGQAAPLKLHLLGSSEVPAIDETWRDLDAAGLAALRKQVMQEALARKKVPVQEWNMVEKQLEIDKNLRAFRAAGLDVEYHHCDVTDRTALQRVLERIRTQDGPIDGVVHGAGFEKAASLGKKKIENVAKTLAVKVDAAMSLMELTRHDPLKYFIGFGSVSGRFGAVGQADYCFSNDLLAKVVCWYRTTRPEVHAAVLDWQLWADVGMGVRPETKNADALAGLIPMPVAEGVAHFLNELRSKCPEPVVVLTDWMHFQRVHPEAQQPRKESPTENGNPTPKTLAPSMVNTAAKSSSDSIVKSQHSTNPRPKTEKPPIRRYVQTLIPTDPPIIGEIPAGSVVILGECPEADVMEARLREQGRRVVRLPCRDPEILRAAAKAVFSREFPTNVVILTARESAAKRIFDPIWQAERRTIGVSCPYIFCQEWFAAYEAAGKPPARIVAGVDLGGDFGFHAEPRSPEGGAISGLVKSISMEAYTVGYERIHVHVVDFQPATTADSVAEALLQELCIADDRLETTYINGVRYIPQSVPQDIQPSSHDSGIRPGMVCVALGGGRGVTAATAFGIARRYGLKMHLLGRTSLADLQPEYTKLDESELKTVRIEKMRHWIAEGKSGTAEWQRIVAQLEIDKTLKMFHAAGLEASYHQCDVTNPTQLEQTLETIRAREGAIHGIIHGAGISQPVRFVKAQLPRIQASLSAKIDAAITVMRATERDPIKFFVGFGSLSGRFGINGGQDYSMGNEMLCKLIGLYRKRRPEVKAVGFHWHAWGEVGRMVWSSNSLGLTLMPVEFGVRTLIQELDSGCQESEIVVCDGTYLQSFYDFIDAKRSPTIENQKQQLPPLLSGFTRGENGESEATLTVEPLTDPYLAQHIFKNRPLFPFVGYVEACAEAARLSLDQSGPLMIENLAVIQPLRALSDRTIHPVVRMKAVGKQVECEFTCDFANQKNVVLQKNRIHFKCQIGNPGVEPSDSSIVQPPTDYRKPSPYPEDKSFLYHGPIYRRITGLKLLGDELWCSVSTPAPDDFFGRSTHGKHVMPAALIDACLYAAGILNYHRDHEQSSILIPSSMERLTLHNPPSPGSTAYIRVVHRGTDEAFARFDVELRSAQGELLLSIQNYAGIVVSQAAPSQPVGAA